MLIVTADVLIVKVFTLSDATKIYFLNPSYLQCVKDCGIHSQKD